MLFEQRLLKKIELTYDQWQDWLAENTPENWDTDSTLELLAYFGFVNFMMAKENLPDLDLQKLDVLIFGEPSESEKTLDNLKPKVN